MTHHVLISLVISGTHAELGFGVLVEETFDDLSLVRVSGTDFDVLLALETQGERHEWSVISEFAREGESNARRVHRSEGSLAYSRA